MPSRLLHLDETAERMRCSTAQLRWMRYSKTGPASALIAGRVMYRESEIEAYIEAQFADDAAGRRGAA